MNINDSLNIEGAYARNYTMFGLLMVVIFCCLWLADIFTISLIVGSVVFVFFIIEFTLHNRLEKLFADDTFVFYTPVQLSVISLIGGFFSFICFKIIFQSYKFAHFNINELNLVSTYAKSLLLSLAISYLVLMAKAMILSMNLVGYINVKRGIFAFAHRIAVLLRSFLVTKYWLKYFSDSQDATFFAIVFSNDFSLSQIYLIVKFLFIAQLIWDFDGIRRAYLASFSTIYHIPDPDRIDECLICQSTNVNLNPNKNHQQIVELRCCHQFCYSCISKALNEKPFCPICLSAPIDVPKFSYYDGFFSFSSIFCCF